MNGQLLESAYNLYEKNLHDYAYSILQNHHDASDAVQTAFITIAEKNGVKNDYGFLKRIVRFNAFDIIRSSKRRRCREELYNVDCPSYYDIDDELQINVYDFMEDLNAREEAVVLFYLQKRTQNEIANILGFDQTTVSRILKSSIKKMKASIMSQVGR